MWWSLVAGAEARPPNGEAAGRWATAAAAAKGPLPTGTPTEILLQVAAAWLLAGVVTLTVAE